MYKGRAINQSSWIIERHQYHPLHFNTTLTCNHMVQTTDHLNVSMDHWVFLSFLAAKPKNVRKKWQVEFCQIFHPKKVVRRYLQSTISTFKLEFHLEDGLVEQRYFELFFLAWSIFSSYKRSLLNEAVFTLFYICCDFSQIFCTIVIQVFSMENMGH